MLRLVVVYVFCLGLANRCAFIVPFFLFRTLLGNVNRGMRDTIPLVKRVVMPPFLR